MRNKTYIILSGYYDGVHIDVATGKQKELEDEYDNNVATPIVIELGEFRSKFDKALSKFTQGGRMRNGKCPKCKEERIK